MKRNILSLIILLAAIAFAIIFYIIIFSRYESVWFDVNAIFFLCMVTFIMACGIFVSAIILEKSNKNNNSNQQ